MRNPDIVITVQSPSGLQIFKVWAVHPDNIPEGVTTVHKISNPDGSFRDDLVLITVAEIRQYGQGNVDSMTIN